MGFSPLDSLATSFFLAYIQPKVKLGGASGLILKSVNIVRARIQPNAIMGAYENVTRILGPGLQSFLRVKGYLNLRSQQFLNLKSY